MNMGQPDNTRLYIAAAFIAGVVVTVGIDRISRSKHQRSRGALHGDGRSQAGTGVITPNVPQPPPIVDGIEGCIGNTPLIRIRSLSEATGCEILAKAEV